MADLFRSLQAALADRYQLERELGRGGMATVYLGRELKHGRDIAIKVLQPELAGVMTRGRFLREIRISSLLSHPHIVPLLDSDSVQPEGYQQTLPYYTMPLIVGESLRDRMRRERELSLDDTLAIARDVASALDYAHAQGIIHRDIKPENILLTGGQALVADFGIARALKEAVDPNAVTSAGLVIGTAAYMSPQQAAGDAELDARSDIYSLGCVVYEMLGGDPPFTGPSAQAILARHRLDPVPTLRTLRPTIPEQVERAILRALSKSPGDRFATAGKFVAALEGEATTSATRAPARTRAVRLVLAAVTLIAAALAWRVWSPAGPGLAANKVMVFPLGETPPGTLQEGTGAVVALMIGSALEYTDPLVWIDGEPRLSPAARRDPNLLATGEAGRIATQAGARWFLDGSVVRRGDSVTVVLRLNDVEGDSVVARASASRVAAEAAQAGLAAVNQILPRLLSPGQKMADLSALADRRPAAVALWLQGEREYRSFNFATALEFQERAIGEDSSLAVAAIRGAQAANWLNDATENSLSDLTLRNLALLPGRMAPFARGLHAYGTGQADSAVAWLTQALITDPEWTEAHMSLGDVYYHLLPSVPEPLGPLAEAEFRAAASDSGFSPPRYHLAEIAVRSGDTARAKESVVEFLRVARGNASSDQQNQLRIMLACALRGRGGVDWRREAAAGLAPVLIAATSLASGAAFPGCAEDGFRAVFDLPGVSLGYRWGAFLGLQALLAAEGRTTELRAVVDTALAAGLDFANQLYVIDALAGVPVESAAADVAARTARDPRSEPQAYAVWLAGEWFAQAGDRAATEAMRAELLRRAEGNRGIGMQQIVDLLGARLSLLSGDTVAAIRGLRAAMHFGRSDQLAWGVGESLAPDRLLLAELFLATGQPQAALAAASIFDHPQPIVFVAYLPASLRVRRTAAMALGLKDEAQEYERRLAALGQDHDLARGSIPPTQEAP